LGKEFEHLKNKREKPGSDRRRVIYRRVCRLKKKLLGINTGPFGREESSRSNKSRWVLSEGMGEVEVGKKERSEKEGKKTSSEVWVKKKERRLTRGKGKKKIVY